LKQIKEKTKYNNGNHQYGFWCLTQSEAP